MKRRPLRPNPKAAARFAIDALTDAERRDLLILLRGPAWVSAACPRPVAQVVHPAYADIFRLRGWAIVSLDEDGLPFKIRLTGAGKRLAQILEEITR